MKCSKSVVLFAAIVTLLPLSAFAAQKNGGKITLFEPATVGSTRLDPGTYKVEWTGTGSAVQVSFLQNKKTVATTTAELKTNNREVTQDAVVLKVNDNSSPKQIAEIDFGGHKEALVLIAQTNPSQGQ
jgi:hypothetical protein